VNTIWIFDTWKTVFTLEQLEKVLQDTKADRLKLQDCDDYALQLYAMVDLIDQSYAFCEVAGFYNSVFNDVHHMNLAVLEDDIKIIEPQTDEMFEPDSKKYDIFYLRG
jgi:predicted HAD superfamily Cof-like phosphohydrolase